MTTLKKDGNKKEISVLLASERNLFIDTLKAQINASQSAFTITKSELIDSAIFLVEQKLDFQNIDFSKVTNPSSMRDFLMSLCVPCVSDGEDIEHGIDVEDVEDGTEGVEPQPPEWIFDKGHIEDQIAQWRLTQVTVEIDEVEDQRGKKRKVLRTNPTGDDPTLNFVFEPFEGKGHDILYLGVRMEKSALWELYYTTPAQPNFGAGKVRFVVEGSPDFQNLEIKITTSAWAEGDVTKIRLDPGDFRADRAVGEAGDKIPAEITYISFRGKPEEVAKAKLKIT